MSKVKKIIIISVVLGIVGIMAITTLVLALVPVNKNRTIETPNDIYITNKTTEGYDGGFKAASISDATSNGTRIINEFMEAFNSGFEQKALVSLFNGQMDEGFETGYSSVAGSSEKISKNYDTTEKFTVIFHYYETKTLTIESTNTTFEYDYLFFEVTNSNERQLVTFGVVKGDTYIAGSYSYISYRYFYTAKANFNELYKYIRTIRGLGAN